MADPIVRLRIDLESTSAQKALEQLNRAEAFDRLAASTQSASRAFFEAQAQVTSLREAITKVGTGNSGYDLLSRQLKQSERDAAAARQRIEELNRALRASREASGAAPGSNNAAVSAALQQQAQLTLARSNLGVRDTQAVRAEIERLTQSYTVLRASGGASTAELANASRNLRQRVAELNQELAGSGGGGAGAALASRFAAFAAPAAILGGLVGVSRQLIETGADLDTLENKLRTVFGDQRLAGQAFEFVEGEARRLGLSLTTTANDYANLAAAAKGTRLEGQATRDIYSAVAEASAKLGLSSNDTSRALLAIQQIISKGTVSAEELRGQLGEVLPGAFQIAARAAGVTTAELGKLLQEGKLISDDFLPKLGVEIRKTFGTDGTTQIESVRSGVERLKLEILDLAKAPAEFSARFVSSQADALAAEIRFARESPKTAAALKLLETPIRFTLGKSFAEIAKEANTARDAIAAYNHALDEQVPARNIDPLKALSLTRVIGNIGTRFAPPDTSSAPSLEPKLTQREAALREEAALQKLVGNEAKTRYKIEFGSLKDATQLEKTFALEIARTADRQAASANQRKQSSSEDVADYQQQRAAIAAVSNVLGAANALATTELDAQFRANLIGYESYFRQRAALQQQANNQEIQQRQAELSALSGQASAVRTGPDADSADGVRKLTVIENSRVKIQQDINALKIKALDIDAQTDAAVREASAQAEQRLNDIRQQIAQQQRDTEGVAQTTRVRLEQQFAQDLQGPNGATVRGFIDTQVTQAQFEVVKQQAADLTATLQNQFNTLSQGVQAGTITTAQAQGTFSAALAQANPNLQALLAQLRELAAGLGPDAAESVTQIAANLQGLSLQAQSPFDRLLATWQDTTSQLQNASASFAQDFTDRLAGFLSGGKLGFKDFANSVIKELQRIALQKAFAALFKSFGGSSTLGGAIGSISKAFGFAEGGAVRGPGGPTSDQIPAMLSNGEYVLRAAAVQRLGVGFLDAVNGGSTRRVAAFAAGGLVGSAPTSAGGFGGPTISVTNNYDFRGAGPDQVQQLLQYGEKIKNETKREIFDAIKRRTAPTK